MAANYSADFLQKYVGGLLHLNPGSKLNYNYYIGYITALQLSSQISHHSS